MLSKLQNVLIAIWEQKTSVTKKSSTFRWPADCIKITQNHPPRNQINDDQSIC